MASENFNFFRSPHWAKQFTASASMTRGTSTVGRNSCIKWTVSASVEIPGPTATADFPFSCSASRSFARRDRVPFVVSGRGTVITSRGLNSTALWQLSGRARVTRPHPARSAPRAVSPAAPPLPCDPAMTSTCPKSPLCEWSGLLGNHEAMSSGSTISTEIDCEAMAFCGTPISITSISPMTPAEGKAAWLLFSMAKASVRSA